MNDERQKDSWMDVGGFEILLRLKSIISRLFSVESQHAEHVTKLDVISLEEWLIGLFLGKFCMNYP